MVVADIAGKKTKNRRVLLIFLQSRFFHSPCEYDEPSNKAFPFFLYIYIFLCLHFYYPYLLQSMWLNYHNLWSIRYIGKKKPGQFFHTWYVITCTCTTILKSEGPCSQCMYSFDRSRNSPGISNLKSIKLETIFKGAHNYHLIYLNKRSQLMNWTLIDNAFKGSFKMFKECVHRPIDWNWCDHNSDNK